MGMLSKCILVILICSIFGCSSLSNKNMSASDAKKDAMYFFAEHPEYIKSKNMEDLLYKIFVEVRTLPENKNKSLYQLLDYSHDRVNLLIQFDKNETIS